MGNCNQKYRGDDVSSFLLKPREAGFSLKETGARLREDLRSFSICNQDQKWKEYPVDCGKTRKAVQDLGRQIIEF